ncbi:hypothetical protein ABKA04_008930 [Annulohypoxylon sp. FPYF3050]
MEMEEISDQFFTYDGRLESFKTAHPVARRPSNAKGKGPKTITWPHEEPSPVQLAQAGLFFEPTPDAPDNTVCFLCIKAMAGWESSDSPIEEHLRLSPHCGWAIVAAIDAGLGDYGEDDPMGIEMTEARKATFAGRWPHDGKRGWKCKTKQLVDAGWKYTPTVDSDDMVSCTYCSLALDGWEPKDDPYEEHYRRSPGCQFFRLLAQYKGAAKKKGRGKGARGSQASRLSVQSVASTAASDMASVLEHHIDHEDSVMTTTSVMTQGGTKRSRAKKGTAAKGKKTRTKKEAPIEVLEDEPQVEEEMPPPPPPKPTRGRKRGSDTLEESELTIAEAPAAKKRARRTHKTNTADASVVDQDNDLEMVDANLVPKPKAKGKKGKAATTRKARNVSGASTISITSQQEDAAHMMEMDDEELNRQLEADLDRPLSDDENIAADSDSDRKKAPIKSKSKKATTKNTAANHVDAHDDHAMFDPEPPIIDEAAVDAELKAMETEMDVVQEENLQVPKKGRKAGTRKASKQATKKTKVQEPVEPEPEPEPEQQDAEMANEDELAEGHDVSRVSNATIVRTSLSSNAAPKKRGRPSKKAAIASSDSAKPDELADGEAKVDSSFRIERRVSTEKASVVKKKAVQIPVSSPSVDKSPPLPPAQSEEPQAPATPNSTISPAPAARQAVVSPSPSLQTSDAENEPPSSKPSNTTNSNRVALAPVAVTPVRSSPSKRNILAGLRSTVPWTAADVDMVFDDLERENPLGPAKSLRSGVDLSSPEKRMTVEEWIYHNAEEAQQKLKYECEAMVSAFEREGARAMQALEGLVID